MKSLRHFSLSEKALSWKMIWKVPARQISIIRILCSLYVSSEESFFNLLTKASKDKSEIIWYHSDTHGNFLQNTRKSLANEQRIEFSSNP